MKQLRQLLQTILGGHLRLLIAVFLVIFVAILAIVYIKAYLSPERYEAQAILHYRPEKGENIPSENAQYVLQVLSKNAMRDQFLKQENINRYNKNERPGIKVMAIERNKNVDRFDIRVSARHQRQAIYLTNAFAEHCTKAYVANRTARLDEMEKSLTAEYEKNKQDLVGINSRKIELGGGMQIDEQERVRERLQRDLDDLQGKQHGLNEALNSQQELCKTLAAEIGRLNPALIDKEKLKFLRAQKAALNKMDNEIMLAQNKYTEKNPTMINLLSDRAAVVERLQRFMAENKIADKDLNDLDTATELIERLKKEQTELKILTNKKRESDDRIGGVLGKLRGVESNIARYRKNQPEIEALTLETFKIQEAQKKLNSHLAEIRKLRPLIKEDLRIGETSHSAVALMPFNKKNIFVYVFSAISLTMLLASLTVLLEFWFGRVSGAKELAIIPELRYLGALPTSDTLFESERKKLMAFSTICHNFQMSENDFHIVLAGALPGGKLIPELFESFEWSYAMAGKKTLAIDMVLANNFDYDVPPNIDTGIIVYSGGKGFLPVASKHYLAPSEQMLLKQDLEILRKSYDLIFIRHSASLRSDRLFFEQIFALCDSAILAVGAKRTPRKMLRQLTTLQRKTSLPIMTILSESSPSEFNKDQFMEGEA
ncbi:MAG: hypothetical protein J6Y54_00295 [Lentisphaeria bacterium]|nr:hypothetical protein [Lentisphaeria bacterium]